VPIPSQRRALGLLFALLCLAFVGIAVASADAGVWVIALASAALAVWLGSMAWRALRRR